MATTWSELEPLKLAEYDDPALRRVCQPVERIDENLKRTVQDMCRVMLQAGGVGLAAPQVGLDMRLFILMVGDRQLGVFINPVILNRSGGVGVAEEQCLSLKGFRGSVARPKKILFSAYNLDGSGIKAAASGLLSRAIQHEMDHLDGILFVDKLTETSKMAARAWLREWNEDTRKPS